MNRGEILRFAQNDINGDFAEVLLLGRGCGVSLFVNDWLIMAKSSEMAVFRSRLGWMGLIVHEATIERLTFGHATAAEARLALGDLPPEKNVANRGLAPLVCRLQKYAAGGMDDFLDVRVDLRWASDFQRRVWNHCRRIPYGSTVTYAQLAFRSGCSGAARAVGNCMAANRIPLVIPCHRVVCSDGRLGAYSAPGGTDMKRRLLMLESYDVAAYSDLPP